MMDSSVEPGSGLTRQPRRHVIKLNVFPSEASFLSFYVIYFVFDVHLE